MTMIQTEQLVGAGGRLWERDGVARVYFNDLAELLGLSVSYYGTGNISAAALNGERLSNTRARAMVAGLSTAKFWFDCADQKFYGRGLDSATITDLANAVRQRIG